MGCHVRRPVTRLWLHMTCLVCPPRRPCSAFKAAAATLDMALHQHTLLSAIQLCLEEDTCPTVAAGDASAGTAEPLPPPLPHHVVAALRRDDGVDLPSFPALAFNGEPPPAPRTWTGLPRAPLAAALAEVLATWAAAGAFPLVFAPLSPFLELSVEGGGRMRGVKGATVLPAAATTSATRETAAATVGVATTAASTGGSGGCVNGGLLLPRPVRVPDMEALTPAVVALVRRINQGAYAQGSGGGGGSTHSGTAASGTTTPVNGAAAAASPALHPSEGNVVATARLLLRSLGAAHIARCLGCRTTPTTIVGALPPPAGALVAAAAAPHRPPRQNGAVTAPAAAAASAAAASDPAPRRRPRISPSPLTVAGRALMKHLGRRPAGWGTCYWGTEAAAAAGGDEAKSTAAAAAVARVLTDAVWLNVHTLPGGAQGAVVEARVPGGYGARWAWDAGGGGAPAGGFRGFLEPHVLQPRPWEQRAAASTAAAAGDGGAAVGVDDAEEGRGR